MNKSIAIVWVSVALMLTGCFDAKEVKQVKGGVLQLCPSHTVEQMVNGFIGSPSWSSGKSDSGQVFVNVEGDVTLNEKPAKAMIQFFINDSQFEFNAFELNGDPSSNFFAFEMMRKMCERAK